MITETLDIYEKYGISRLPEQEGYLECMAMSLPEVSEKRTRPAILILPGGGYEHVSRREAEPVALGFAAKGWAAFVLRYSCAPSPFPVALREAALAMRFIRENAARFQVDPHMVAAMGFSAGGHLCGTLGTMYDCPELVDIGPGEMLRPDALGLCYPVTVSRGKTHEGSFRNVSGGHPDLSDRLSLDTLVRPDMPPVFLWHTRDDGTVPVYGTLKLACALEAAGVDFAMHIYRHGRHGLSTADALVYRSDDLPEVSDDVPGWLDAEIAFFDEIGLKIRDFGGNR